MCEIFKLAKQGELSHWDSYILVVKDIILQELNLASKPQQ